MLPNIPGEGTLFYDNGIVAGAWAEALRFVHFQVSEYAGRECADALASPQSLSLHDRPNRGEEQHNHVSG